MVAVLSLVKGVSGIGRDNTPPQTAAPKGFAPFATTSKLNDEKHPYNAFATPGGELNSPIRPKTEVKMVKAAYTQYYGEKRSKLLKHS